ncbi:MAG: ComEA family DNA-binding protein [Anaerolineae bacterium]|jgi:competence ComEA-like helix-hairpin-helix protein
MKRILKLIFGLLVVYLIVRILIEYLRPVRVELQEQAEPPPPPPPSPVPPPPSPAPPPSAPAPTLERLDLNQADVAALTALPGVGPALAERILAHRQQSGPFASLDDLTQVRGIGPALVTRLRPLATVDE